MLGVYIHIPYCLQRCSYCDFATYVTGTTLAEEEYADLLQLEIQTRHHGITERQIETIYFGGGTPSLVQPKILQNCIKTLLNCGFTLSPSAELTIEINPGTIPDEKLRQYQDMGINRYSLGAQTFHDRLLKACQRQHSAEDTRRTLQILNERNLNFSLDLLFALPQQSLADLKYDLTELLRFSPPHVSPYCLTIPKNHPLNQGRPSEQIQVEMFNAIESALVSAGLERYEISNFARPGFASKHNLLYWTDENFWGVGLSAHSYIKANPWGVRFWNPSDMNTYAQQIRKKSADAWPMPWSALPDDQQEGLQLHQALTDYCHTALRMSQGLSQEALRCKFDEPMLENFVLPRLDRLRTKTLLQNSSNQWTLTNSGLLLSNLVFSELTFLKEELTSKFANTY